MTNHVVIIGGGILALEVAAALINLDNTVRVRIIAGGPIPSASAAAGAMIAPWSEITAMSISAPDHDERIKWTSLAHDLWRQTLDGVQWDGRPIITGRGSFVIANTMSGHLEDRNFGAIHDELRDRSVPHEHLDPRDVPGIDPAPYARPHAAIHVPDEFTVDSSALLAWRRSWLHASGRADFSTDVARPVVKNAKLLGVTTIGGDFVRASAVIVAAGVTTRRTLPHDVQSEVPPLISGAGGALVLRPTQETGIRSCIRTPNRAFACGLHVLPTRENDVYVGATNNVLTEPWTRISISDTEFLSRCARTQVRRDLSLAGVVEVRSGNRPISADLAPIVGRTSIPGLHVMSGTYRDGLTLSPALSRAVASEVLGASAELPDAWRPGRAPQSFDKEGVVRSLVEHQLASISEHELDLSHAGIHEEVEQYYAKKAERALEAWGESASLVSAEILAWVDPTDDVGREISSYFRSAKRTSPEG